MGDLKEAHEKALEEACGTGQFSKPMIAAYIKSLEAQGWVLVPKEITPTMCAVGRKAFRDAGLLPAYTDEGAPGQTPLMMHMLRKAWPEIISARPTLEGEE